MHPLGQTRTSIQPNYAFIAPDSHVLTPLPGWTKTEGAVFISPRLGLGTGPQFSQYLAIMEAAGTAGLPLSGVERFIYVMKGSLTFEVGPKTHHLSAGHFAYVPPDQIHHLQAIQPSRLMVFERRYLPLAGVGLPGVVVGSEREAKSTAFMGDADVQLKTLLPAEPVFDLAVNLLSFQPGASLPQVEVHVMEHGLVLMAGQGIYRLDDAWYPIQSGDVIWMGPYCPQWFAALGKTPSTYLYYKDVGRDPLERGR